MHRAEQEITDQDALVEVLRSNEYVTLALCREDEPYVVTLSYGYDGDRNALYFHCAQEGLKLAFIRANPRACATVVEDRGYIQGKCAHAYRTVVFWGEMQVVDSLEEKRHGMDVMLNHLEDDPDIVRANTLSEDSAYDRVCILRMDVHEISGKQGQ